MHDCMEKSEVHQDKWHFCVIRWWGPAVECDGKGTPSHIPPQLVTLAHMGYRILTWLRTANYRAGINPTAHLVPDTAWFLHLQEGWINSSSQQHHCHNKLGLPREVTGRITSILQRLTKWFNPAASLGSILARQWLTINAHMLLVLEITVEASPWQVLQRPRCGQAAVSTAWKSSCAFYPQLLPSSGMQFPTCLVGLDFNPDGRKSLGLRGFLGASFGEGCTFFDTFPSYCKGQLTRARGNTLLSQWSKTNKQKREKEV